ncbi:FABP family protein [Lysinibacter sp. HNR]|uniref:FABP family protein n=1 Tax=Lysinibacter sp. HNR TaxID=3031408 RepID=UPI002435028E|nr:FABP family protein [Lysinibacter sp. HNR]WGD38119.1 FABP family protein [Lysinibacter sp. HNR]
MINIRTDIPAELGPLSWLIGVWEGTGVIEYSVDGKRISQEFGQRVSFSHDGLPYLNYNSYSWLIGPNLAEEPEGDRQDDVAQAATAPDKDVALNSGADTQTPMVGVDEVFSQGERPLVSEMGYWRLSRPRTEHDPGPGMLPGSGDTVYGTAESVEALRIPLAEGEGFPLEVLLVHPTGVGELYLGRIAGPRIDLATDYVMRAEGAKEYTAASRMYGLVDNHLLWAWDMAALGQPLRSHASARLAKRD